MNEIIITHKWNIKGKQLQDMPDTNNAWKMNVDHGKDFNA